MEAAAAIACAKGCIYFQLIYKGLYIPIKDIPGVCAWLHSFAASLARVRTLESPIPLQVWGYLLLKEPQWGFNFMYNVLVCVVCCCMLLYIDLQSVQSHALTAYKAYACPFV